jgi:hypothetical protein
VAALARLERLPEKGPEARDYQRDLGEALHELAVLRSREDAEPAEALRLFARALDLRKYLCRQPDARHSDLRDLARTHGYLGDLLLRLDRLADADLAYWESQRIRLRLSKEERDDPDEAQFQLARAYGNFAAYHTRTGSPATARFFLEQALEIQRALAKKNAAVTEYQTDLADSCNAEAELLLRLEDRGDPQWRKQAMELAREAEAIFSKQSKGSAVAGLGLTRSLLLQARVKADRTPGEARLLLGPVLVLLDEALGQRRTPEALYQRAAATALLAETVEAATPERLREELRKQALALLVEAWTKQPSRLRPDDVRQDRAFKTLQKRPDFEKVLTSPPAVGHKADPRAGEVPGRGQKGDR